MTLRAAQFPLTGGLDLVTPAISKPPGSAISGFNYLPQPEGYARVGGYERFDGRPLASAASYWVLDFDAGTAAIAEGATVTGATSGATGKALQAGVVSAGAYGTNNAAGYLVLTAVSGTFADNENLQVSAVTKCVANGAAAERGASNDTDDATWLADAVATARALIGAVPGSGAMRGVVQLGSTVYAFRDNAGGTAGAIYKSTSSGWALCSLGRRVEFTSGGTTEILEGQTVAGATSAATAVVSRVVVTGGSWAAGDASGSLILSSQTGTFSAENLNISGGAGNVATVAGDSAPITRLPGGHCDFAVYNFAGAAGTRRVYGADGVNPGFEWDGTVYTPIYTGMTTDTPVHVACHRNYLFFSFGQGSVQFSGVGDPYAWDVILGAGELAIGDEVTALLSGWQSVLVIAGRNRLSVLQGSVFSGAQADGVLAPVSEEAGCARWSMQQLEQPVFLDDRGVRDMASTQNYGDFRTGTRSILVKPWIDAKKRAGVTVTASLRIRDRNQYWLFFSDGSGLAMDSASGKHFFMPLALGFTARCSLSAEDANGVERLYAAGDDGYVFRLNSGNTFDGAEVTALVRLAFGHQGSPSVVKRYQSATLEVTADPTATLYFTADFSYGSPDQPSSSEQSFSISGSGGFWNEDAWDQFYWSAQTEGQAQARTPGRGSNISFAIFAKAADEPTHVLHGMTLLYDPRKLQR
jgi:hypothetical protein